MTNFQRDIAYINQLMAEGLQTLLRGSYADRHPGQGRMVKCPLCGRRRRELPLEPCCNTEHATTQRAWSPEIGFHQVEHKEWDDNLKEWVPAPRVVEALMGKGFFKKFTHKRHSNLRRKQLHDLILAMSGQVYEDGALTAESQKVAEDFRNTIQLFMEGLPGFHTPENPVPLQSIPNFAERVLREEHKSVKKRESKQQDESRKINREER